MKAKLRFITEADTLKARMSMGYADRDAKELNVLIFPISDECHDFRGDLAAFNNKIRADVLGDKAQGIRGILDDLLRRIRPEDTVLLTSDHGFTELLTSEAVSIPVAEAERTGRNPQEDIHYRFTKGFRPPTSGDVVQSAGITDIHFMAVGSHWFRREGVTNTPRYDHGGISLAEVVIPAIRLRRVTEKEARVDISGLNTSPLVVEEDKQAELTFAVENVGNVAVEFEFHAQSNLGEELAHVRSTLAPRATHPVKIPNHRRIPGDSFQRARSHWHGYCYKPSFASHRPEWSLAGGDRRECNHYCKGETKENAPGYGRAQRVR